MNTHLDPHELHEAIAPVLEKLEAQREHVCALVSKANFVTGGIIVTGLIIGVAVSGPSGNWGVFLFAGIAGVILGSLVHGFMTKKEVDAFRRLYKSTVVGEVIQRTHPELHYSPDSGVSESMFCSSNLFSSPDRYSSEDGISGKIGDTDVWFSEVHAEEKRRSKNRTYYVDIFDGIFMVADFHKHFRSTVRVVPDTAEKLFGFLGKALQSFRPLSSEKLVYLEDPEFEKEFAVYGSDQVEARYILSTSMVGRILDLKAKWGNNIRMAFAGSQVYIAISHTSDLLEPDLKTSSHDRDQVIRFAYELEQCFSIVEDLNLNTRIWTKE